MKKTTILLSMIMLCTTMTMAQKETKKFSFGIGMEAGLPTGIAANIYNLAAGVTIRFSYHVGPGFVTLTTGGIGYEPKKVSNQPEKVGLQIPVRAGYKYIIQHHFFVMGEMGYSDYKTYFGKQGTIQSTGRFAVVAAPSVGVQFNVFEISLHLEEDISSGGGGLASLRIGFNF